MSVAATFDSAVAWSFGLEIDGIQHSVMEVSGLKLEVDVTEVKQNNDKGIGVWTKSPAKQKPGEFTVTVPLTDKSKVFDDWFKLSLLGDLACRKSAAVVFYEHKVVEVKRITLLNCWVKSLEHSAVKAFDTAPSTLKVTISYDMIQV